MMLTFEAMEQKYGSAAAYYWLAEIEKTVHIPSAEMAGVDPELRLAYACRVQAAHSARLAA